MMAGMMMVRFMGMISPWASDEVSGLPQLLRRARTTLLRHTDLPTLLDYYVP
jgi:hypothetical protein